MATETQSVVDAASTDTPATQCHECDAMMVRTVRPRTLTYKGRSETVDLPGWYCDGCGESIHSGADMAVSGQAIRRMKALAENALLPEQVKSIRRKLGLTQKKAGELIGGGANAFFKYERGEVVPSQAVSNLLRVLNASPSMLSTLVPVEEARRRPEGAGTRVAGGVEIIEIDAANPVRGGRRARPQKEEFGVSG